MKKYLLGLSAIVFLSACSTKEVFKPESVSGDWEKEQRIPSKIVDVAANIALLDDSSALSKTAHIDIKIPQSHRVIAKSDEWVISASIDGDTTLTSMSDMSVQKNFALKKTIASANVSKNILAVIFADNEIALYDIDSKAVLFKEQGASASVVDGRITPPYFMGGLVLFGTLDGKVVIVNSELKKRLRTTIVSSEDNFNNIIYMTLLNNKIVAATPYKLLSMSQKDAREAYEIRNLAFDDENIYITTKQGNVISMNPELQVNAKIKFAFAHFLGMISLGEKLYILEKEGYLIVVDKKSFNYTIYETDVDDDFVFVGENHFYVENRKIILE